ncbi:hypothetical protein DBR28_10610 [Chryseobacterium sp. HMWF028]|nr:hypothetical protein DBR28_10610 [Chryseobacterium sp. HMWF028]
MAKNFTILWIFYKKILLPALLFSLLISFWLPFRTQTFGLSFLLTAPVLHYFIYELRFKNEYYFYANAGLSRTFLWAGTIVSSLTVKIITSFL